MGRIVIPTAKRVGTLQKVASSVRREVKAVNHAASLLEAHEAARAPDDDVVHEQSERLDVERPRHVEDVAGQHERRRTGWASTDTTEQTPNTEYVGTAVDGKGVDCGIPNDRGGNMRALLLLGSPCVGSLP